MKKRILVLALGVLPVLLATGVALAAGVFGEARSATSGFRHVEDAVEAGYSVRVADAAGVECIASPEGAMGIHMLNPSLLDGRIDERTPELLVYEPTKHGRLKLVALEYLVFQADWAGAKPPQLFGHDFDLIPAGNRYGLPAFYALHAWIFKNNPRGALYAWNPKVDCD